MFTLSQLTCLLLGLTSPVFAAPEPEARAILSRTTETVGFSKTTARVLHFHYMEGAEQDFQSSPPFVTILSSGESWFSSETGIERADVQVVVPGAGPGQPSTTIGSQSVQFAIHNAAPVPMSGSATFQRNLNLWAVLTDWNTATDIRRGQDEPFRDYSRVVLVRMGPFGDERAFIDPKTRVPVKLERAEPHYLWGQVTVEYTYGIWRQQGDALFPTASARVVDGFKEFTRTVGTFTVEERATAPDLTVPAVHPIVESIPPFLQTIRPTKVPIDSHLFLSANPGYTEAIALIGQIVYVFDATRGEARAQFDLELIEQTFGSGHPIAVVVTDRAWPHLAGIRFWVAFGARVISHPRSKGFLERVINRRWTRAPDLLERRRRQIRFKFDPVDPSLSPSSLDRDVRLYPIDGAGSEGVLMAYLPQNGFLWASDYLQSIERPSVYVAEVWAAVRRASLSSRSTAAMHRRLPSGL